MAGFLAALSLAGVGDVVVLTKANPGESNTGYAQGGIAAVFAPAIRRIRYARDTIGAGAGLSDPAAVRFAKRDGRVLKVRDAVRPWRMTGASAGFAVVEMRAGSLAAADTMRGDVLQVVEI